MARKKTTKYAYVLDRQCAACDGATLSHQWLCYDCQYIQPFRLVKNDSHRIYGPLLPPVIPSHAPHKWQPGAR